MYADQLPGRGNDRRMVTMPYHVSCSDLAPKCRARFIGQRCHINHCIFPIGSLQKQLIHVYVIEILFANLYFLLSSSCHVHSKIYCVLSEPCVYISVHYINEQAPHRLPRRFSALHLDNTDAYARRASSA